MRQMRRFLRQLVGVSLGTALVVTGCSRAGQPQQAQAPEPGLVAALPSERDMINHGLAYLRAHQAEDGAFRSGEPNLPVDLGVTGLAIQAMATAPQGSGKPGDEPAISKAVGFLLAHQEAEGGIRGDTLATYTSSIAIVALEALHDPKYKDNIDRAVAYVKKQQCSGYTGPDSYKNGGFGYGSTDRPDLSNTQVAMDAFEAAGLSKDDPAYKEVVVFLSRCQNNSETNDQAFAGTDGGSVYNPVDSKAGKYTKEDGSQGWRSYGSMTYALLKSMLYANLSKDDPRVAAAVGWIKKNYTLDENPGLGKQGLYYYYHTFAKAMAAYGQETITDDQGKQHAWRSDLIAKLASLQKPDGSWVNEADKWHEGDPVLVTCFAVLALEEATPKSTP